MPENYSLQLNGSNPISTNIVSFKILPNISNDSLIVGNFIITNLSTNQQIVNSENPSDKYSIASVSGGTTETTFQINFANGILSTTPISIQFKQDNSNYSNVLNVFQLQLSSISANSVTVTVPNRIGSVIALNNLIIKDLSNNSVLNNYSISEATITSCIITFSINDFLNSTPISIQFKELDSNNNIIAISTFAYINFPSPYDSTIEISKAYLVKYIGTLCKVKITLQNRYDSTLPTEYKNIIYKAIKQ